MSHQENLLYEAKGRIATITINRPEKAHAFTVAMLKTMYEMLNKADKDEKIRCILIKSTGKRIFCAGYDLKEGLKSPEITKQIIEWGRKISEAMLMLKKPIITQVQGIAIGFGVLITLASDFRIFADRPKEELYLRLPEIAISLFPQTGATIIPLLVFGLNYAKNLLFTSDKVGVEELKNINFPTRVFPLESLEVKTLAFAKQIRKYQTEFLFTMKTMLTIMNKAYLKSCFDLEDECAKFSYEKKKTNKQINEFIKELHKKYP